jgi:hypothetical protein
MLIVCKGVMVIFEKKRNADNDFRARLQNVGINRDKLERAPVKQENSYTLKYLKPSC